MPVIVTADLHLSDNSRDQYRHDFQLVLRKMVQEYRADAVIVVGDLCEAKDRHSAELVNQVVSHFTRLSALCPVYIEKGNHDYVNIASPFFAFLGKLPRITWINQPTESDEYLTKLIGPSLFLPHTPNYKRDWKGLDFTDLSWIFAHNTFEGARSDSGHPLSGIPTDVFPDDARVLSGDVHTPQRVDVVHYIGAPYTVDFGDAYKARMMLVDNKGWKSIPYTGPQKRLADIVKLSDLEDQDHINPGDIVKVRMSITAAQRDLWPEFQKEIRAWGEQNKINIYSVLPQLVGSNTKKRDKAKEIDLKSDEELIALFAKRKGVGDDFLKVGLDILRGSK
jgi:DNA repair exonuclease SbcCD nuclease subunit